MSIRFKISVLIVVLMSVSVPTSYLIQRFAVMPSFLALESAHASEDWDLCQNAILKDLDSLSQLCFDWASWDDPYHYVQGNNPDFHAGNLDNPQWFIDQQMDVLYIVKTDGSVYWKHVAQLEPGIPITLEWLPPDRLPPDHPLMGVTAHKDSKVEGVFRTKLGFILLTSRPILTSQYEGPMAGVLIFGRRLTDERIDELKEQVGVEFTIIDPKSKNLTEHDREVIAGAGKSLTPTQTLTSSEQLSVTGYFNDGHSEPVMVIQTTGDRSISLQGRHATKIATWSLVIAGFVSLLAILIVVGKIVTNPLMALSEHAKRVGQSGKLSDKIQCNRDDELGILASSFNQMLEKLEQLRVSSIKLSRQAGKAEVATGVLHNVGNAMTNVCVIADSMDNKLAHTHLPSLRKVSGLLSEHSDNLPALFSPGQKGTHLPAYLATLTEQLTAESALIQQDLTSLRDGLGHVKLIVASHQGIAKTENFIERACLLDIVGSVLPLVEASYAKHAIEIDLNRNMEVDVYCDASKLTQVIINLLTNAKDALTIAQTASPRVEISVAGAENGSVSLEITDNGPGIKPEYIDRLFTKGFTTKSDGQGIGLHYCWLAMKEMNGSLTLVRSINGIGTTFRLDIPTKAQAKRKAA